MRTDEGLQKGILIMQRTKKDLWIEMSIREVCTQIHFAELAYQNIDQKANNTDVVFSSIHSFLSHCAMVSKLLEARELVSKLPYQSTKSVVIGDLLGIPASSIIHKRKFRNSLEHYDKELKEWIGKYPLSVNIGTYNIGPKSMFGTQILLVSHYDPSKGIFTFVNKDFNLSVMFQELQTIKNAANCWVQDVDSGRKQPPYF
jgi:hypothetical protein